jgi:gluconokinase
MSAHDMSGGVGGAGTSVGVVVVMGVAGSGKTTVGSALAVSLGWRFVDGDDFHSPESVAKMARGEPLTDADRGPWLERLRAVVADALARGAPVVMACSALKQSYRDRLTVDGARVRFVHLAGDPALLRARLERRAGHFMTAAMLDSQLAALEPPAGALSLDAALPPDLLVARICQALGLAAGPDHAR